MSLSRVVHAFFRKLVHILERFLSFRLVVGIESLSKCNDVFTKSEANLGRCNARIDGLDILIGLISDIFEQGR